MTKVKTFKEFQNSKYDTEDINEAAELLGYHPEDLDEDADLYRIYADSAYIEGHDNGACMVFILIIDNQSWSSEGEDDMEKLELKLWEWYKDNQNSSNYERIKKNIQCCRAQGKLQNHRV